MLENVRNADIYIIQPTCPPVNDNLMELLLCASAVRRAAAAHVTAVVPYYGYARQDRKERSRVPISAADVAKMMEAMGIDRVCCVDLHCGQIQGFFGPRTPVVSDGPANSSLSSPTSPPRLSLPPSSTAFLSPLFHPLPPSSTALLCQDNLYATPIAISYFATRQLQSIAVVTLFVVWRCIARAGRFR